MDETTFLEIANKTLFNLSEAIENADLEGKLDVELHDGILDITIDDGKKYVINRHTAMRQIWMSSPFSGASHYSYQNNNWITRDNKNLPEMIKQEMNKLGLGVSI